MERLMCEVKDNRSSNKQDILTKIKSSELYKKLKKIKNIEIIIAVVVCVLVVGIYAIANTANKSKSKKPTTVITQATLDSAAKELSEILSSIKGAGKIKVLITYDGKGEIIPAQTINTHTNVTIDNSGNSTRTTETTTETKNTVIVQKNGSSEPIILKEILPNIVGIIVVAEGAANINVRVALLRAVQAATGVKIDRIEVFEMAK